MSYPGGWKRRQRKPPTSDTSSSNNSDNIYNNYSTSANYKIDNKSGTATRPPPPLPSTSYKQGSAEVDDILEASRRSSIVETSMIFSTLIKGGYRTLAFCKVGQNYDGYILCIFVVYLCMCDIVILQ